VKDSSLVRARVIVTGRVQGVWFRDSCRRDAVGRGVAGWARNRMDGSVEAVFEGPSGAVAQCVSWCRIGPPRAEVTGIEVAEAPPEGLVGFRVR
jgi:acylphosphatase